MRDYELVYIVSPQVGDENLTRVVEKVNQIIATRGGQVDKVDTWGKRRLAYPIGSFKEGFYFLTYFKMDAPQAQELESSLRTSEEIIRHLVVRLEPEQVKQRLERELQQQRQQQQREQERLAQAQKAAEQREEQAQKAAEQRQEQAQQAPEPQAEQQAAEPLEEQQAPEPEETQAEESTKASE